MIISFGKHRGEELDDVPASYLLWLYEQDWIEKPLRAYIETNLRLLKWEAREEKELREDELDLIFCGNGEEFWND